MADIELVIKIPKAYYELVLERCKDPVLLNAFKNGTPLPKGHGDLIDRNQILQGEHFVMLGDIKVGDKNFGKHEIDMFPKQTIMNVKPVIEAEKKYEAKVITRGNCMMCGKELTEGLFFCKECEDKANSRK